jgi:hypothetical protein
MTDPQNLTRPWCVLPQIGFPNVSSPAHRAGFLLNRAQLVGVEARARGPVVRPCESGPRSQGGGPECELGLPSGPTVVFPERPGPGIPAAPTSLPPSRAGISPTRAYTFDRPRDGRGWAAGFWGMAVPQWSGTSVVRCPSSVAGRRRLRRRRRHRDRRRRVVVVFIVLSSSSFFSSSSFSSSTASLPAFLPSSSTLSCCSTWSRSWSSAIESARTW